MEENNKINELKENTTGFVKKHKTSIIIGATAVGAFILGVAVRHFGPKVIGAIASAGANAAATEAMVGAEAMATDIAIDAAAAGAAAIV